MHHSRRLLLPDLHNARDLGGYATADGGVTRFGVFVRSEAPCNLSQTTIQALTDYGICATADLRGLEEAQLRPSQLQQVADYYSHCLAGKAESFALSEAISWEQVYIARAEDNRPWAKAVLELAASQEGGLLYHCTTGKDRTGIISCYLLAIAGVSPSDITADYCVSEAYLQPVFAAMRAGTLQVRKGEPCDYDESLFHTPASAMAAFQDYLIETYGSVVDYLKTAQVSQQTMDAIREKFVSRPSDKF